MLFGIPRLRALHPWSRFYLGAIAGTDILRDTPAPNIDQKTIPILAFLYMGQAPIYGQIRSRTSGIMWSYLCETPHVSQDPNFPAFQELQVRPIILPYAIVCATLLL